MANCNGLGIVKKVKIGESAAKLLNIVGRQDTKNVQRLSVCTEYPPNVWEHSVEMQDGSSIKKDWEIENTHLKN